jgi:hypothetical protein
MIQGPVASPTARVAVQNIRNRTLHFSDTDQCNSKQFCSESFLSWIKPAVAEYKCQCRHSEVNRDNAQRDRSELPSFVGDGQDHAVGRKLDASQHNKG